MKKQVLAILAVLVVGAGVGGGFWWSRYREARTEDEYSGVLEALEVDLRAEVGGKVIAVWAEEGDKLQAGQTVCELDRSKYELQLKAAEAELAAQSVKLEAMEAGAREQELKQVEMLRDQAMIQKDKAAKDYERLSKAAGEYADGFSERELENARVMMELAEKNAERAQQAYDLVVAGIRDEEKRAQIAIRDAVQAKVDLYRIQLEDTVIKTPISGRLVERYVEPGELVLPGGLVATVANYRKLKLKVYVPGDKVGALRLKQRAEVTVDGFPGVKYRGWVSYKSKQAEFTPKNVQTKEERTTLVYQVTVIVDNPMGNAIAGLPADVRFIKESPKAEAELKPAGALPGTTVQPGASPGTVPGATTQLLPAATVQPAGATTAAPGATASPGTTTKPGTTASPGADVTPGNTTGVSPSEAAPP